ncbi:MAG: alpha/beta hydrolase [Acidobacteriota bacterium]|nr:alpha/beta hydrolase [Acidobacteriota bacterium]MDH3528605.1 alpha/beta hydrolase [Acidobacteriota bacterium]
MAKKHVALGVGGVIGATVAWKLLTRASTVEWDDAVDEIHHAEHSKFIDIDGVKIHFQEFGAESDPVMLLIHGYTASTYVWKTVAPEFADRGLRVISVDLLGFGFSEKPAWFDYSIASQSRMLLRLMNRLGIGKATMVGSSYGGAIVSWFALDNAERIEKLVLVGSVINDRPMTNPLMKIVRSPAIGDAIGPFLIDSKRFLRYRMHGTIDPANHHLITDERIESIMRPLRAADAHHALLATARNWDANRIEEDAHLIDHPTLLIWGEGDTVIPRANGEKLYDRMLNSRLIVLKDCGHIPHEEKPELFVELVTEFCRDSAGRLVARDDEALTLEQAD